MSLNEAAGRGVKYAMKPLVLSVAVSLVLASCGGADLGGATPTASPPPSATVATSPTLSPPITASPSPTASGTSTPTAVPSRSPTPTPSGRPAASVAGLVGRKLIVAMAGTMPDADLLGRVRRGEVGGVILFGSNIQTAAQVLGLTAALQAAARAGGQPHLLIAVDQEGGAVKRIPWIGPTLAPPALGALDDPAVARAQGVSTGSALQGLGIDIDLAPVVDVPAAPDAFIAEQGRAFSSSPTVVADVGLAFAQGLLAAGVVPALKHFPGLGLAAMNTDLSVVTIDAAAVGLAPGLVPYRAAIADRLPLIMLSNATYPAWDPNAAAGWSRAVGTSLLRGQLGFAGVTMTDSLDGTAAARGLPVSSLAIAAALAGTDLILTTGSEASSRAVYAALLQEAQAGRLSRLALEASYARIRALVGRT